KQLLYAFPATMFAVNLTIFYAVYWVIRLTGPEDQRVNRITREAPFEEVVLLGYEMRPMVIAAFLVTLLLIGAAYVLGRRAKA
ncbi:MAG: TRAP transporter permease DctQ, partial [Pseudomonadota bacterium]